jgi:hypothetical protein
LDGTLEAAERLHQAVAEAPLDLLEGMGVAEERTEALRQTSRNVLRSFYGGIGELAGALGRR